uniref:Protocadherin-16 n=1 Tax=Geotrypetes seraphini TaxID=260995 RepID=A0A6P8R8Z0_GEOSA|nr:protocadherin-23 isoform X2 [Geotrypetes seraphini]
MPEVPVTAQRVMQGFGRGRWPRQQPVLGLLLHLCFCSRAQVHHLHLTVDEGLPPGTLVGDIRAGLPAAHTPGYGGDGFFISEERGDSPVLADLHVDAATGVIRTARVLDRERRPRYRFVAATLLGELVQVTVGVRDVNDHAPAFPRDVVRLDISEVSPAGASFRLEGARDPDAGSFGLQGYTLREAEPAGGAFFFQLRYETGAGDGEEPAAAPTLDLVLARRLDRESAERHRLLIEALDGGSPPRTGRLEVQVRVVDENDNAPSFNQSEYLAAVPESAAPGNVVCQVYATDPDLGSNGDVLYSLLGGRSGLDYFSVEERSGLVRVRRPLDRETRARHELLVRARDAGAPPESSSVRLTVRVLDENDNRPELRVFWLTEGGAPRVSEGAPLGEYVARVSASDADEEREGPPSVELRGGAGAFALLSVEPGLYFLCVAGPLDREARELYELRLVATDAGSPPLTSRRTLLLHVADVNDQAPVFARREYRAAVSEAASTGTAVLRLVAADGDSPGPASEVRFSLGGSAATAFRVDPLSGVISTARALDRETEETLQLLAVATDLGEPPLASTCTVTVAVEDVNDNEPVFLQLVFNVSLPEHAPLGHCFLQVKATDADSGQFGHIQYFLYDGFHNYESSYLFHIDPNTGHICVSQDIDKEKDPSSFDLLVKAKDGGGLTAQAFVRIEIEDINDNHPIFDPLMYMMSISSHTQPGTEILSVIASDQDSGIYGDVTYELLPGEHSSLFTIDSSTGIIYLISSLSHLESSSISLSICAQDRGGLVSIISAMVTINILQTVMAPAVFERSHYSFFVAEDTPEYSPVGTVKARGPLNSLESVSYRISSGDSYGSFTIDSLFGIIRTKRWLDHETQPFVILTVQAQLGHSPVFSRTQINITVSDVNDNTPVFLAESEKISLSQSTLPGTSIYIANAKDKDSGLNGMVTYSIANEMQKIFVIDSIFGVVSLNGSLSSATQDEYILHITAEDSGNPPLSSVFKLTIAVEQSKAESVLIFDHLINQIEISESFSLFTRILQVQAHLIGAQNITSNIVYSMEPSIDSLMFGIHSSTGWIFLRRPLDYETKNVYSVQVRASSTRQNGITSVTVNVLDENDNSPTFTYELYFFRVEESFAPQGVVGTVTAFDSDSGRNGQLSYFLLSDGKYFNINSQTGEIIDWVALDREKQTHHQLTVLVTDNGTPRHSSTTSVYILVSDLNDNPPCFPQVPFGKELNIKVLEAQQEDMLVVALFAKDPDAVENGTVMYSLSPEETLGHFKIDAKSGELRTTMALSYRQRPRYKITITAYDQGTPLLKGHAVINIQIIPVSNKETSVFQNIRHLVIPETFKPGQVILSMKPAPDQLQANQNMHFRITSESDDIHFGIDGTTGDIFLSKELDYETNSHYLLRVDAVDFSKTPVLNYTVFFGIDIEDRNDHSPSFLDDFIVVTIEENLPLGTLLYICDAKDADGSLVNSKLHYSVHISDSNENLFHINPYNGILTTGIQFDREITQSVTIIVTASDQEVNITERQMDSMTIKVVILDMNDNSPSFVSLPVSYVMEDTEVGSLVHHIIAKDPDEGSNGQIAYHIFSGNENNVFLLHNLTGLLTLSSPLDHETQKYYNLNVVAFDNGTSVCSSVQTLTIVVLDVNDEVPSFKQQLYEATILANQVAGQFVVKVEAIDRDSGINSQLSFEILPGTESELFKINADTGEVITATTFDWHEQQPFVMKVLVTDGGSPSLSSTATIICRVISVNCHTPEFVSSVATIQIPENQDPKIVHILLAVDIDASYDGSIQYQITGGNIGEFFSINATSGELWTAHSLDREDVSNFTIIIECYDLGYPRKSSTSQLQISVIDENDNFPIFSESQYHTSVREDLATGSMVFDLLALDKDQDLNGKVIYSLIDNTYGVFTINNTTGTIITTKALDRETKSFYEFGAVASDCSIHSPKSTTVKIVVHIDDVNDNSPVFLENPVVAHLADEISVNQTVACMKAEDTDLGLNGTVVYRFMKTETMFQINRQTGEIQLQKSLSSLEHFKVKMLQVVAIDQGTPARSSTGLVVIYMQEQEKEISFIHNFYEVTLLENSVAGTPVIRVKADYTNPNSDNIEYEIFSGDEDRAFSINPVTGDLAVKEPKFLDFEVKRKMQLVVLAKSSRQTAYCTVTVLIKDVNDNAPRFEQSYHRVSVLEGQIYNTFIMQVFVTDIDCEINGQIEYSIISGNENEAFFIDPLQGILSTNAILDCEICSSYRLVLQATDRGHPRLSSTSTIEIQVMDVNDNGPIFPLLEAIDIAENVPLGHIVTCISANDVDLSSTLSYSFTEDGNPGMKFAIDWYSGLIILVKPLDFEETTSYQLWIRASDSVHKEETNLTIQVLDVNDNPPVFMQDSYQIAVPELTPSNTFILTVSAKDQDSKLNGIISYKILSLSKGFWIDPNNGTCDLDWPLLYGWITATLFT